MFDFMSVFLFLLRIVPKTFFKKQKTKSLLFKREGFWLKYIF